jgi:hypothetical protein
LISGRLKILVLVLLLLIAGPEGLKLHGEFQEILGADFFDFHLRKSA